MKMRSTFRPHAAVRCALNATALLLAFHPLPDSALAEDAPKVVEPKPQEPPATAPEIQAETITELTPEQLVSKVPHFYYLDYRFGAHPGKRLWLRLDAKTWIERYPDGSESRFQVLGHTVVNGMHGTLVVKMSGDPGLTGTYNDGSLQAFIPDRGNERMQHWFRNTARRETGWSCLGDMKSVE